jgi:hypothetical protein
MGQAADDLFDAELSRADALEMALSAGVKACPRTPQHFNTDQPCPVCDELGWIDKNGNPCEL